MDRIPTTNGCALGGGWETIAGPMAGMPAGRFREREVRVATAMPQPRTVEFDPARQPVPAFRPPAGPRTGQGPLGIALESATEPLGTPSGACAAGDVREQHASLPEPVPTRGYRSIWNAFVRWCGEHNAQHWPASPETVADYL